MGLVRRHIAMIGTTGVGKSSLSNILMGISPDVNASGGFPVGADADSCTMDIDARDGFWLGDRSKPIRIIDTPGHGDGRGRDNMLREKLVRGMKNQKFVHAFIWVKNAEDPRYTDQDRQFREIFGQMFGTGMNTNLIVILTRFKYSTDAERTRARTGVSLEKKIQSLRQAIGDSQAQVPMFAIDSYFNPDCQQEVAEFSKACSLAWAAIERLGSTGVEHAEVVRDRIDLLSNQLSSLNAQMETMRQDHQKEVARLTKELEEARNKQQNTYITHHHHHHPPPCVIS